MLLQKRTALLPVLFAWFSLSAQPSQSSFIHYNTDQGLSNDHITGITKDKLGFLWVSTVNGLNRFDGRTFKIFHHDPDDPNSLPDDQVVAVTLAPNGWLWIATNKGLCKLDPASLDIIRISLPENADTIPNDLVTKVGFDSKGMAWTTGHTGIYGINPVSDQVDFFYKTDRPSLGWYGMMIDLNDRLWLLKDTLRRFDPVTKKIKLFNGVNPNESLAHAGCLSLVQDHEGHIWAGTWGYGIWKYQPDQDDFARLHNTPNLSVMLLPDALASGTQFFWVGGGNSGLYIFYPETEKSVEYIPNPEDPFTHNNYLATTFFKDPSGGDVWIGTEVGLEHYAPATIRFGRAMIPHEKDMSQFSLVSGVVHDNIDETGQRYFIALWGYGLFEWNRVTGKFTRLRSKTKFTGGGNFNLLQDKQGIVWGCMNDGIGRYDPRTGQWRDYEMFFEHNERKNLIWYGLEDRKGNLWFGSNREGLFSYNPETDSIKQAFYKKEYADANGYLPVMRMSEDAMGRIWMACNASGLIRFDPSTGESKQFIYSVKDAPLACNAVEAGSNGKVYATFYDSFLELDSEGEMLRLYNQQNGLKSNRLHFVIEDQQGKIWFNSIYLLHRFDPVSGTFQYYGKPDGLFSNIITDALCITPSGEIFVGFQNAFNFFYPDQLRRNSIPPPVVITSIKVMNKERKEDAVLVLKPGEDFFEIEFAALNFNQQERNQYAYILEGFNKEWIYTDRPVATFTNLDGGQYLLRMKAANNDGVWNEQGTSLRILVNPPFYKTEWFFVLIALAIAGLIGGVMWFRRQQRRRIEVFRESLARDLHDEMGSTLSSIRFFSEYATGQIGQNQPQVVPVLQRISQSASNLSESMQDIIWAMKTKNDQLEDLAAHMMEFGLRILEAKNVKFKTQISDDFSGRHLKPEVRRNIYLIFKEAVNNAAKYSDATEVNLKCEVFRGTLVMKISDNGRGFDINNPAEGSGYGTINMRKRAEDIGGTLTIASGPGEGTDIELQVRV